MLLDVHYLTAAMNFRLYSNILIRSNPLRLLRSKNLASLRVNIKPPNEVEKGFFIQLVVQLNKGLLAQGKPWAFMLPHKQHYKNISYSFKYTA